jgi:hypothetical protein
MALVAAVGTLLPATHVTRDVALVFADGLLGCTIFAAATLIRLRGVGSGGQASGSPPPRAPAYPMLYMAARTGAATWLAGAAATTIGLQRPAWAMLVAAGAMALGTYAAIVTERALAYTGGTAVGVALAGLLLTVHPDELLLAPVLGILAFLSQLFVIRNFAIAMMFVTPLALGIVDASAPNQAVGTLLWTRLANTAIGALAGVLIAQAVRPAWAVSWLHAAMTETKDAMSAATDDPEPLRRALARLELVRTRTAGERHAVREAVQRLDQDLDNLRHLAEARLEEEQTSPSEHQ